MERIEEDTIRYFVYIDFDLKLEDILVTLVVPTAAHIWHDETINFSRKEQPTLHFVGNTHYGENIEDEWKVIELLIILSQKFPTLVIRCEDFDGDPLLIEAADVLPDWIDESTSMNRVFINNGSVHLIPDDRAFPRNIRTAEDGADIVRKHSSITINKPITKAIDKRLSKCRSMKLLHRFSCPLPSTFAYIAHKRPDITALAINAYIKRTPKQIKKCRQSMADDELLKTCSLLFTRHQFAMISQQSIIPIVGAINSIWSIPRDEHDPDFDRITLGYKLTCGLHMLRDAGELKKNDKEMNENCEMIDAVIARLLTLSDNDQDSTISRDTIVDMCQRMMGYTSLNELERAISSLPDNYLSMLNDLPSIPDDDDSWMHVNEVDIPTAFGSKLATETRNIFAKLSPDADKCDIGIVHDMKVFLTEQCGGYGGAEVKKQKSSKTSNRNKRVSSEKKKTESDPDGFNRSLSKILAVDGINDLVTYASSDSDGDSYSEENDHETNIKFDSYMKAMDRELNATGVMSGYERRNVNTNGASSSSGDKQSVNSVDDEIDIDRNLAKHLLASFKSETGASGGGPTSTLLCGLQMAKLAERDLDSDDDDD